METCFIFILDVREVHILKAKSVLIVHVPHVGDARHDRASSDFFLFSKIYLSPRNQ